VSVFVFTKKLWAFSFFGWFSAAFREMVARARLRLRCSAPRLELHGLQAGT
jgi:hypothetical protein